MLNLHSMKFPILASQKCLFQCQIPIFSDVDILGLEIEREQDTEQEVVLDLPDPKTLDVKAIIEKKMKELARKRKIEQAAAHGDQRAFKRPHI